MREEGRQKERQRRRENSSNTREIKKVGVAHLRKIPEEGLAAGSVKVIDHHKKQGILPEEEKAPGSLK